MEAAENDPTQARILERIQNRPGSALKKAMSVRTEIPDSTKLEVSEGKKFPSEASNKSQSNTA